MQEEKVKKILKEALERIKPSKEEIEKETGQVDEIVRRLERIVPRNVEIRVVGSLVHGTNLRGSSDIDVFLLFDKKKSKKEITKEGLDYAKKIIGKDDDYEIKYAEHPYLRAYLYSLGVEADIVPAYKIENIEEMATAVDRSPLHTEFVLSQLSEKEKDEVRLLKFFLKNHDLYGAEVYTGGFSGYLCELLVYQFGSFYNVLKFFAEAKLPIVIEPKSKDLNKNIELVKKFYSKFVVVDPVDPDRNVAAPVSMESLARFTLLARAFVAKPSKSLFYDKGFSHEEAASWLNAFLRTAGFHIFVMVTKLPKKSEDITWPQLRKTAEIIKEFANAYSYNFEFAIPVVFEDKGIMMFVSRELQAQSRIMKGPSVFMKTASDLFLKKHKRAIATFLKDDLLFAIEPNRFASAEELLRFVAKGGLRKRRKDIMLKGAKLYVDKVPEDYIDIVYGELRKKFLNL
ncbi:MAG: CCA tRNA nucleotidyltransferase [Candidatus Micrarchaeia archaeon]